MGTGRIIYTVEWLFSTGSQRPAWSSGGIIHPLQQHVSQVTPMPCTGLMDTGLKWRELWALILSTQHWHLLALLEICRSRGADRTMEWTEADLLSVCRMQRAGRVIEETLSQSVWFSGRVPACADPDGLAVGRQWIYLPLIILLSMLKFSLRRHRSIA